MKTLAHLLLTLLVSLTAHQVVANTTDSVETVADPKVEKRLVDPTRPNWFGAKKGKSKSGNLVLNSLVTSPQRRIAVINGELMREGDTKRGITLKQILSDRVLIVSKNGKKRALKLNNASLRISKTPHDDVHNLAQNAEGTTR